MKDDPELAEMRESSAELGSSALRTVEGLLNFHKTYQRMPPTIQAAMRVALPGLRAARDELDRMIADMIRS